MAKTDIERLTTKHEGLTHSEDRKVLSHVQREKEDYLSLLSKIVRNAKVRKQTRQFLLNEFEKHRQVHISKLMEEFDEIIKKYNETKKF